MMITGTQQQQPDSKNVLQWAYNKLEQHLSGCKVSRMQLLKSHPYAPLLQTEMSGSSNLHAYHILPEKKNIKKWRGFEKEVSRAMQRWGSQWEVKPRFMHEPHSRNQAIVASCEQDSQRLFMGLLDSINFMMIEDTLKENWSDHKIFFWSLRLRSEWLGMKQKGVPDASSYVMFFNSASGAYEYAFSKISLEVKTADALPGSTQKDAIGNENVFSQICGYMVANDLDIGILTSLTYTWFLQRNGDVYHVSDGIPYHDHVLGAPARTSASPTLMECLFYVSTITCKRAVSDRVRRRRRST